jgi:hypothetical protein
MPRAGVLCGIFEAIYQKLEQVKVIQASLPIFHTIFSRIQ